MNIKLDTVLAYALILPFILSYGLAPKTTPLWLFSLIFLGLVAFALLDIVSIKKTIANNLKNILLGFLVIAVIGSAALSVITLRRETVSTYKVHDIIIQQEIAVRYLLLGLNPYKEDYFNTPLEDWHFSENEENPALYHFVMQPLYLLFSVPFFMVTGRYLGYFDGRFPLLVLFASALVFLWLAIKDSEKRRAAVLLFAFNPLGLPYLIEGRSDIFMLGFLLPALFFLQKKKLIFSSIFMAAAFAVKQSIWPLFPFYFMYLYFSHKKKRDIIKPLIIFGITFAVIVMPFFIWDPKAYIDSTILYLSGNTVHSYPISGYGFGIFLYQLGIIKDLTSQFPFVIFQAIICLSLLVFLMKYIKKNPSVRVMLILYSIFLFVYWYFSRYFNNSHLIYIATILGIAYFWPDDRD